MSEKRLVLSEFWRLGKPGLCLRCGKTDNLWYNRFTNEGVCRRHFATPREIGQARAREQAWRERRR